MPKANRHVCPACEGHDSAQCDVCDGTGARLCDACEPTVAQRAVVSEAGTAVCRPCILRGLADMEREFADLRATWLRLHRSASTGRAETLAAYEAAKRAETHLLDTRAAVRLVLATAANDVTAPDALALEWRTVELRVGFGLIFGRLAQDGTVSRVRWTQHGEAQEVSAPSEAAAMRAARDRIAEINRACDAADAAEDTLVTARPALAAE